MYRFYFTMTFYQQDSTLAQQSQAILAETWAAFPWLARNQLAFTWLVYDPPFPVNTGGALASTEFWTYPVRGVSYRGMERIYPASVVKLFYLVACHEWLDKGMLSPSRELDRALQDMIVDSSNDATGYVLDLLTGTTSGPELSAGPFETWKAQRNIVNRYFQGLGWVELESINANQKTWSDGPYGREDAFVGPMRENRNMLTTDATARLLHSIVGGVAVSAGRSQLMLETMYRSLDPEVLAADPENQVVGFIGDCLPQDARVWSKAGWTSTVRHDAAYVELPDKYPYLLVVFTEGKQASQNTDLIPFISTKVAATVPEKAILA
ncbi:MAG: serine hydrolase [Thermosynechococcaceae cyanobacterium]